MRKFGILDESGLIFENFYEEEKWG